MSPDVCPLYPKFCDVGDVASGMMRSDELLFIAKMERWPLAGHHNDTVKNPSLDPQASPVGKTGTVQCRAVVGTGFLPWIADFFS